MSSEDLLHAYCPLMCMPEGTTIFDPMLHEVSLQHLMMLMIRACRSEQAWATTMMGLIWPMLEPPTLRGRMSPPCQEKPDAQQWPGL